jgi:hypothetical protein
MGILFGRLLARIAQYFPNGSPREVTFHRLAKEFVARKKPHGDRESSQA